MDPHLSSWLDEAEGDGVHDVRRWWRADAPSLARPSLAAGSARRWTASSIPTVHVLRRLCSCVRRFGRWDGQQVVDALAAMMKGLNAQSKSVFVVGDPRRR